MREKQTVDVIIPSYHPGKEFEELLKRLEKQDYPIHRILIMNTEKQYWDQQWEDFDLVEVHHLTKQEFDHGGTRDQAAQLSKADILVFMTQDAIPADASLIRNLVRPFKEQEKIGASYARQLPAEDCSFTERYTRSFNYPETSVLKTKKDLPELGIKTYFCSNVCAAYDRNIYSKLGGFVKKAIFNEDMIYAGKLIQNGYGVAYAADAKVIHSHNYSCMQQLHRNFDLGVSQADHPEIFSGIPSEGEGIRLVRKTAAYLFHSGKIWLLPGLFFQSGFKYAGYLAGKKYKHLPNFLIKKLTMNPEYWKK